MPKHPQAIFVQLTTACNAECVGCPHRFTYGREGKHAKGVMPDEVWHGLLDQIAHARYCGQVGLYLHHEPLMVASLCQKIQEVNEQTVAFTVVATNAALLDEEMCRSLIDAQPRRVHINICSADYEQYEAAMPGLDYNAVFRNAHRFIEAAYGKIAVEINCPVVDGVDVGALFRVFPGVQINAQFWANSRGGLLPSVSARGHGTRFKLDRHCVQPTVNFNVLWDGSVILCCQDWAHESKPDFPVITEQDLFKTYDGVLMNRVRDEFNVRDYRRYQMCRKCAVEMDFIQ